MAKTTDKKHSDSVVSGEMEVVRVLFLGTAEFAWPALKALAQRRLGESFELVGLVTQPDRPVGRKQILTAPPLKRLLLDLQASNSHDSQANGFQIFQPEKLAQQAEEILAAIKPDLIITAAYGQMVPSAVLDYPKYGCLNIHGSLLPMYRGAVPLEMSILNGDKVSGVSVIKMTPGLDYGPVLAEKEIELPADADASWLRARAAQEGADLLLSVLPNWVAGKIKPIDQAKLIEKKRELSYCYSKDLAREKGQIHAHDGAVEALRKIRAFAAASGAYLTIFRQSKAIDLKIWRAELLSDELQQSSWGKITQTEKGLVLTLKGGQLLLQELQLAGKNRSDARTYAYLAEDQNAQARIIVKVGDEALFIRRQKFGRSFIVLPGGHLKRGESPVKAAVRELSEETTIKLTSADLTEIHNYTDLATGEKVTYFQVSLPSKPKVQMLGEEVARSSADNTYKLSWINLSSPELALFQPEHLRRKLLGK
jgi:methionyl-tRNA formyltransferase